MPSGLRVLGRRKPQDDGIAATPSPAALPPAPRLSPEKLSLLARWQKDPAKGEAMRRALGKVWNAPNTAIGLGYGLLGHGVGKMMGKNPHINVRDNAVEFTNNPFGGVGAITLGNAVVFNGNPNDLQDSNGVRWADDQGRVTPESGAAAVRHEDQHVKQGEMLGPLYLPSNLLGGAYALARGQNWHGDLNWNERGPQENPPRPWARRSQ